MKLDEAMDKIHEIWKEHDAAVLYLDDAPVLRFMKNEIRDDEMYIVLMHFINNEHKAWFTYYDIEDCLT